MENKSNGMSIAALVCGICGIVLFWIPYGNIITLVLSILGIVFGVKGRKVCANKGLGTAGLVLGIIGTCFSGLGCAICTCPTICTCILGGTGALAGLM